MGVNAKDQVARQDIHDHIKNSRLHRGILFQTIVHPAEGDLVAVITFGDDGPLLDIDYEVSVTSSFNVAWNITGKTLEGFTLEWNNAAPLDSEILVRVKE